MIQARAGDSFKTMMSVQFGCDEEFFQPLPIVTNQYILKHGALPELYILPAHDISPQPPIKSIIMTRNRSANNWPRWLLWTLFALPSLAMVTALVNGGVSPERLLHPSGEFATRFMIIAMMATPLRLLFGGRPWTLWLVRNRRYFGVAAFLYAMFHTGLYIIDIGALQAILDEFFTLGIWTGWLATFIFLPLGLTSNDYSVRRLGRTWKTLQRTTYIAAVATLAHWIFVHNDLGPALVHFAPLALLQAYRIWHIQFRKPKLKAQTT